MRISRRRFLALAGAAVASAAGSAWFLGKKVPFSRRFGGRIVGASHALGHRLRDGGFPPPSRRIRTGIVIAGAGVAGLSAAWKLRRSGFDDFLVLDLEPEAGGTSRGGCDPVSAHPWGAHYLPVPGARARAVRELLEEMGTLTGWSPSGEPRYDERQLCFEPQERLYLHGRWQEGLFPRLGASAEDLRQLAAFEGAMQGFRGTGKFSIPMETSARDPGLLDLDRLSMAAWMDARGWGSPRLRWWVDYCCRDDFGCSLSETSAWAGIHYFAAREDRSVLTWPEGNARLVAGLSRGLGARIQPNALVHRISQDREGVTVDYLDAATGEGGRVSCREVVAAMPRFVAARVVEGLQGPSTFDYAPWMVANLFLERAPEPRSGDAPLSWDNVIHESPSLGYIVATHQSLRTVPGPTVLTYYRPFSGEDPVVARTRMLATPWEGWVDQILADLGRAHPDLPGSLTRLDVMLWGHGMVRPRPGFLWGSERQEALRPRGRIHLAHSDLSGMALFEEAQYRGVLAAEAVLSGFGHPFESSL